MMVKVVGVVAAIMMVTVGTSGDGYDGEVG